MAEILAHLDVLSQETGCLLDLAAIVNVCPKIDIMMHHPHKTEHKDDHVYVTPTKKYGRRCDDGSCYEVSDKVCKKPEVALDLELLVVLGLLTDDELTQYGKCTGAVDEDDCVKVEDGDCKVDPLLSVKVGDKGDILDLEVDGKDGLVDLDLLGSDLLNINRRAASRSLLDLDILNDDDKSSSGKTCSKDHSGLINHYKPMCKKAFKKEHRDKAHKCHATDVNHCLSICNAESALLTINADVKVGDIADIQLCAAIEFDDSVSGKNCHYYVAPENKPCTEDQLEDSDKCYAFMKK